MIHHYRICLACFRLSRALKIFLSYARAAPKAPILYRVTLKCPEALFSLQYADMVLQICEDR